MQLRYQNQVCYLGSMHKKEIAIAPAFEELLGCKMIPSEINTDLLGTFTGEIQRTLSPLECAKQKCYRGLDVYNGQIGIANEGTFGPHPSIPFIVCDFEILFFADKTLDFELTISKTFLETNFATKAIRTIEELSDFAKQALFPSHALILRPMETKEPGLIFKGIQNHEELFPVFEKCLASSKKGIVWVETDMRAHMNPSRMKNIKELSYQMASQLATSCPSCTIPGWGIIKYIPGLPCQECKMPTKLIRSQIYGCCKCDHQEIVEITNGLADPGCCLICNP